MIKKLKDNKNFKIGLIAFIALIICGGFINSCFNKNIDTRSEQLSEKYTFYRNSIDEIQKKLSLNLDQANDAFETLVRYGLNDTITYISKSYTDTSKFDIHSLNKDFEISLKDNVISSVKAVNSSEQAKSQEATTQAKTKSTTTTTTTATTKATVPSEYRSALAKAKTYANSLYMSKAKLYEQLTSEYGEAFSEEAAQYAIDNVTTDYKKNALKKAKSYRDTQNMSPARIYEQLTSEYGEGFTADEAQYAIDNLD